MFCHMKPVGNIFVKINFLKEVRLVKDFHDDLLCKVSDIKFFTD